MAPRSMTSTVFGLVARTSSSQSYLAACRSATPVLITRSYAGLRPRGPGPLPLGSAADQAEFEKLVKEAASTPATSHPDAKAPVPDEFEGDTNPNTGEVGGPKREPVRFGDWSFKGRVTDF
ncbi:hypothetical protein EMPS_05903 [Entomortierella parvispora]|uniref:Succinate dehydrogenase assembly factor 4, mitochondrial n=1 Tax=Entomortierella parvispora TaxID=205924 RepID=A0A9P3HB93_9FUNG|nr:hypothetical protein EMPS_05903 [Entomortierella parvispora]